MFYECRCFKSKMENPDFQSTTIRKSSFSKCGFFSPLIATQEATTHVHVIVVRAFRIIIPDKLSKSNNNNMYINV